MLKTVMTATIACTMMLGAASAHADAAKDEAAIKAALDAGCKGFIAGDVAGAMSPYSKKAFVFDMTPKLNSTYDDVWQGNVKLIAALDGAPTCSYKDMHIVVDHNHAFVHYLLPFTAKLKGGKTLDVVERTTDIFEREDGKWLIIHEHNSVPLDIVEEKIYPHATE